MPPPIPIDNQLQQRSQHPTKRDDKREYLLQK